MNLLDLARSALRDASATEGAALHSAAAPSRHWRIRRAEGELLDVIFSDALALTEVRAIYSDAGELVRQDGEAGREATPATEAELRALVAAILADDTEADWAEALAVALADPVAALTSFRLLASR